MAPPPERPQGLPPEFVLPDLKDLVDEKGTLKGVEPPKLPGTYVSFDPGPPLPSHSHGLFQIMPPTMKKIDFRLVVRENMQAAMEKIKHDFGVALASGSSHAVLGPAMDVQTPSPDTIKDFKEWAEKYKGLAPTQILYDEVELVKPPEPPKKKSPPKPMPEHADTVAWFAMLMEKELAANEIEKDGRNAWLEMEAVEHVYQMLYHTAKIVWALREGNLEQILEYTADVANHSMFCADAAYQGRIATEPESVPLPESQDDEATYQADAAAVQNFKDFCRDLAQRWLSNSPEKDDDDPGYPADQD